LAEPVKTYAASQSTPVRFERITTAERQQLATKSKDLGNFRNQRSSWESPPGQRAASAPAASQHEARPEPKPVPKPSATQPNVVSTTKAPPKEIKPVKKMPAPPVRVTRPEREVVSNPPIAPKPSESRYIEKSSPSRPSPEAHHAGASSSAKPPAEPGKK
jgi:hypothetical protein